MIRELRRQESLRLPDIRVGTIVSRGGNGIYSVDIRGVRYQQVAGNIVDDLAVGQTVRVVVENGVPRIVE